MDDMGMKHAALGNIKAMLKGKRAERLGSLVKPKAEPAPEGETKPDDKEPGKKPAVVEIHAVKLAPADDSAEETAEGGLAPEHPVHAALKKLNQLIKPR